jgi:CIC family chloride channel protein
MGADREHHWTGYPRRWLHATGRRWLLAVLAHGTGRWVFLGGSVGVLCGVAGAIFDLATDLLARVLLGGIAGVPDVVTAPGIHDALDLKDLVALWPVPFLLLLGGCGAGWLIRRFATGARGGGTGQAVRAYHHERGNIPLAIPLTKLAASILTLGTGGSAGREGPISLIGAGFGSWFAGRLALTVRDQRILLAAGIAGGIAAVFRAPLAAALFAAEVLYRGPDLEAEVLIPSFIAAILGYCVSGILVGMWGHGSVESVSTLFSPPGGLHFSVADWPQLLGYTLVALAVALAGRFLVWSSGGIQRRCEASAMPQWIVPGLGAAAAGVLALGLCAGAAFWIGGPAASLALATLGSGYGVLHWLFAAPTVTWSMATLLALIAIIKAVTTGLTVGSGGSGGWFAPSLVIGGCLGGAIGIALSGTVIAPPIAACVLTGMAGLLAATHRTPLAALLMVAEVSGSYLLLLPSMWVNGIAFLLMGRGTLISGQVENVSRSPAHRSHLFSDLLADVRVREALDQQRTWVVFNPQQTLADCRRATTQVHQDIYPVVDAQGRFLGTIDRADLAPTPDEDADMTGLGRRLIGGAGVALRTTDRLSVAMERFRQQGCDELAVIDADGRFLGLVTSGMLIDTYRRLVDRMKADQAQEGYSHASDRLRRTTVGSLPP